MSVTSLRNVSTIIPPIFTKLKIAYWHYVEISYTEFHRKQSTNMEIPVAIQ
jgi:hypothetical protein